ncbi:Hypp2909 [Branchiostoma lanceolatum]|uniref:Hypp2909 protein n=1 Tax=Branchiostoma lanceolatum TaxID=7740 RepID=A0A8J9ZVM8_BRALA|nr:Hypp2909 [Branchiostoma lanceolatum]
MRQEMKVVRASTIDNMKVQTELATLRREIADLKNMRLSASQTVPTPRNATFADVVSDNYPQQTGHPLATKKSQGPVQVHAQGQGGNTKPKSLAPVSHSPRRRRRSSVTTAPDTDGFSVVKRNKSF